MGHTSQCTGVGPGRCYKWQKGPGVGHGEAAETGRREDSSLVRREQPALGAVEGSQVGVKAAAARVPNFQ